MKFGLYKNGSLHKEYINGNKAVAALEFAYDLRPDDTWTIAPMKAEPKKADK